MKPGDTAVINPKIISGTIIDTEYDKDKNELRHLLEYVNADGEVHRRWFLESELKEVTQ
jgi:hypothetical protein